MQNEKAICATSERKLIIDCCETALLAVLIAVSGTFRIPGIVPGTEFQLSAPIAVAICGVLGQTNSSTSSRGRSVQRSRAW